MRTRLIQTLLSLLALGASACGDSDGLSTDVLDERVAAQRDSLEECVGDEEETLMVSLRIAEDGRVAEVAGLVEGEVVEASECVESVVRGWTFPASDSETEAELPLTLRPTEGESDEAPQNE